MTVKCPGCAINFGLWLPKSHAPYVRETVLFETVPSITLAELGLAAPPPPSRMQRASS